MGVEGVKLFDYSARLHKCSHRKNHLSRKTEVYDLSVTPVQSVSVRLGVSALYRSLLFIRLKPDNLRTVGLEVSKSKAFAKGGCTWTDHNKFQIAPSMKRLSKS